MVGWARETLQNPDITREIESFKGIKPETIAQRGGFAAIQARFAKGEFAAKDIHAVLSQIRNKVLSQARTQECDRSRGRSI